MFSKSQSIFEAIPLALSSISENRKGSFSHEQKLKVVNKNMTFRIEEV